MTDWLDDIEAQADDSSPYYLPRLIAEIRRLRAACVDLGGVRPAPDEPEDRGRICPQDGGVCWSCDSHGEKYCEGVAAGKEIAGGVRPETAPSKGLRNLDTPENREFWAGVDQAAAWWKANKPAWADPVSPTRIAPEIDKIIQRVAELPDRTSPDDWPEAMLVTSDELRQILCDALAAEPTRIAEVEQERVEYWRNECVRLGVGLIEGSEDWVEDKQLAPDGEVLPECAVDAAFTVITDLTTQFHRLKENGTYNWKQRAEAAESSLAEARAEIARLQDERNIITTDAAITVTRVIKSLSEE